MKSLKCLIFLSASEKFLSKSKQPAPGSVSAQRWPVRELEVVSCFLLAGRRSWHSLLAPRPLSLMTLSSSPLPWTLWSVPFVEAWAVNVCSACLGLLPHSKFHIWHVKWCILCHMKTTSLVSSVPSLFHFKVAIAWVKVRSYFNKYGHVEGVRDAICNEGC